MPSASSTWASTKCPMRHLAMTGMVTAAMIDLISAGSDMRATPPSLRISAGTRSSAITAQAPASWARRACSGVTTYMITPPFSIRARPALTLKEPFTSPLPRRAPLPSATIEILRGMVRPASLRRIVRTNRPFGARPTEIVRTIRSANPPWVRVAPYTHVFAHNAPAEGGRYTPFAQKACKGGLEPFQDQRPPNSARTVWMLFPLGGGVRASAGGALESHPEPSLV